MNNKIICQVDQRTKLTSIVTLIYHTVQTNRGIDNLMKEIEILLNILNDITKDRLEVIDRLIKFVDKTIKDDDTGKYTTRLLGTRAILNNLREIIKRMERINEKKNNKPA